MGGLIVDASKCRGCGRCTRACASGGIVMEKRLAHVTDSCILCGMCIDACPFDALTIAKDEPQNIQSSEGIWVFATNDGQTISPVVYELLGKGTELARDSHTKLTVLLGCANSQNAEVLSQELITYGADEVILTCDSRFDSNATNVYAAWVVDLVQKYRPAVLLFGATNFGRELAPCVAAKLKTGLTADCTVLSIDKESGLLHQTRPAFGGNLMATIMCPNHRPQMATVRPGIFTKPEPQPGRQGTITRTELKADLLPNVTVREQLQNAQGDSLLGYDTLVVVGRGIGAQKNLTYVQEFADFLGAGLGCSRPLVESGWLEYKHQVGQTGLAVSPKLLISVGVSGAIQHLAGIGGAETVIAVNPDTSAPIHSVATYSVYLDALEVIKELNALLKAKNSQVL